MEYFRHKKTWARNGYGPDDIGKQKFSWDNIRASLPGTTGSHSINIADNAVDRHAEGEAGRHTAVRWIGADGRHGDLSYNALRDESSRFAMVLEHLGLGRGEVVFGLMDRVPVYFTVLFGTLKYLGVFCPLFKSFGPEPVLNRIRQGRAAILVTTKDQFRRKVLASRCNLPFLRHILLIDAVDHWGSDILSLPRLLRDASTDWEIPATSPEDTALLFFTSGTTARPKGVLHVHEAVVAQYHSGITVFDYQPGDIYWCTADPGWVTGTVYAMITPLLHGITTLFDEGAFDAGRWLKTMRREKVSHLYTSPSALRRLVRLDTVPLPEPSLPHLRAVHTVGETLDAATHLKAQALFNKPVYDSWWQTETGSIMIASGPWHAARPGTMGKPLPGIDAAIIDQRTELEAGTGQTGMLALKRGWPSMFRGYLNDENRYLECFLDEWYLTGDMATRDEEGYYRFRGRSDDVITCAGRLVSPHEVEEVLEMHSAVEEAAVFGVPEPLVGERVQACIVLCPGYRSGEQLLRELMAHTRKRLGTAMAPRHLTVVDPLPRTISGKIMRRTLQEEAAGRR